MQQVLLEEDEVARTAAETQSMKDEAQTDLDMAMPALQSSMEALGALNKQDITEIKSFVKPPALVQKTMQAVNTLLQEKPDWETAKKVLTDAQLTKRLMDFDKDSIPDHVIKQIRRFTDDPSFQPENVAKQSNAAKSLCLWVHAMDKYDAVSRQVAPKKEVLRRSEAALLVAMEQLQQKQAQSREVERRVAQLKQQLDDSQREEQSLARKMEVTNARLARAGKLTTSLADEEARWRHTAGTLTASMELLVGDVFLCVAAISYVGPFTGKFREALLSQWHAQCVALNVPVSAQCSLFSTLSGAVEVREWTLRGLPNPNPNPNPNPGARVDAVGLPNPNPNPTQP
jgi:dynein heavy chain